MADRFYSEEEAQEILRLATRRTTSGGGMSRDRLVEAAAEMGIDPAEVLAAEEEVRRKQYRVDLRRQYVEATQNKFYGSAQQLVGTSIMLFGICYLAMGGFHSIWSTWAIWPCGFMALHTLGEAWESLISRTRMGDQDFEKWCEKQQKKQRVVDWIEAHPDSQPAVQAARLACAEFGPKQRDHAVRRVVEATGLRNRDAKRLVDAVFREELWGRLSEATPPVSTYEVARQALNEVGFDRKTDAIELVRARTGLGLQESREAVQAVAELTH